jgi:putative transposase
VAERWVRSAREECLDHLLIVGEECLDHLLIVGEGRLRHVLTAYTAYYNHARPHQGRDQRPPVEAAPCSPQGPVWRRDVLGGLLHDYYRDVA